MQTHALLEANGWVFRRHHVDSVGILGLHCNPISCIDPTGTEAVGAVVGAFVGGFYGGVGSYMAGGGVGEVVASALLGGAFGAGVGALDPTLGVGTYAFVGAASSGMADIVTQLINGDCYNVGSTVGAVVGGAIGGAGGGVLGGAIARAGSGALVSEAGAAAAVGTLTSGSGAFLNAIGAKLGELANDGKCGCGSK